MKYLKIQNDVMKVIDKADLNWRYDFHEDGVWYCSSFLAYFVPKVLSYIDPEKVKKNLNPIDINRICQAEGYVDAVKTSDAKIVCDEKGKQVVAVKICNEKENRAVWVKDKYLANFEYPTFKILGKTSPIQVYENGIFVGIVLPIRVKE